MKNNSRYGPSEWIQVRGRRHEKKGKQIWNDNRGKRMEATKTTTFFFSEIPEDFGAKEMYAIFKENGEIDEVIIPPKRDKRGKRFGFVRFFNVVDARLMAIKLDNIVIGTRKIHANLPRFQRQSAREKIIDKEQVNNDVKGATLLNVDPKGTGKVGYNKSYAQAVRNQQTGIRIQQIGNRSVDVLDHAKKIPFAHLEFNMEDSDLTRFQKAFVGIVENPGATYNMQEYFNMEGYFGVKVTPMGANLCLLEESEAGEIAALIDEVPEWIGQWFQEIRPWRPRDVDNERLTWLRVYGLPCHAWNPKVFDFMTKPVGHFVCSDDQTTNLKNLDVARILIRTKYCLVLNQTYNISINENVFRIKVVEDAHGPMRIAVNFHGNKNKSDGEEEESSEEESGCGEWDAKPSDELWCDSFVQESQPSRLSGSDARKSVGCNTPNSTRKYHA